jgi:hypothetical protein
MTIDFVIGSENPGVEVLRDDFGKVLHMNIDYQLTLLQLHHSVKSQLSATEYELYEQIMTPKAKCDHLPDDHRPTQGYIKEF